MKWLLKFLMKRYLLKEYGKRCAEKSWDEFEESATPCVKCVVWYAYECMFEPFDNGPKDKKFEEELAALTLTEEDYE